MLPGFGGWNDVGQEAPAGRILACDASTVYGFARNQYANGKHPGLGDTHYRLFAADKTPRKIDPSSKKFAAGRRLKFMVRYHWTKKVPMLVRAMVLAEKTLLIAGPPEASDLNETSAAIEGKRGGLLWAVSAADGKRLSQYKLDVPPVFDGMAAAAGRLYLSAKDGSVRCFAGSRVADIAQDGADENE